MTSTQDKVLHLVSTRYSIDSKSRGALPESPTCTLELDLRHQADCGTEELETSRVTLTAECLKETINGLDKIRQQLFSGVSKSK